MDMGAAKGSLKEATHKNLIAFKYSLANWAQPVSPSVKAVNTAPDVHKAVFAAVQGGEREGADELSPVQFRGADGAGLGITGGTFRFGLLVAVFAKAEPLPFSSAKNRNTGAEEQRIAKPE